jgi:hypothetical protein
MPALNGERNISSINNVGRGGGMIQVIKHLSCKGEALSLNPNATKK